MSDNSAHKYEQEFVMHGSGLECIDLSDGPEPVLAAHFNNGLIALYHTITKQVKVHPFAHLQAGYEGVSCNKYSKFLIPRQLAIGTGHAQDSMTVTSDSVSLERQVGIDVLDIPIEQRTSWRANANVSAVASLTAQADGGQSGDVFLAAWGDHAVRLHDLHSPKPYKYTWRNHRRQSCLLCPPFQS